MPNFTPVTVTNGTCSWSLVKGFAFAGAGFPGFVFGTSDVTFRPDGGVASYSIPSGAVHIYLASFPTSPDTVTVPDFYGAFIPPSGPPTNTICRYCGAPATGSFQIRVSQIPAPPDFVSLTPFIATGPSQTFTAVYRDTNGWQDIARASLLINIDPVPNRSCLIEYDRNTATFQLRDDTGNDWLSPATVLSNSQCSLNVANSSASGNGEELTVNYAVTFHPSYGGRRRIYVKADDAGGMTSDW